MSVLSECDDLPEQFDIRTIMLFYM